jgi:hypothetical protein
MGNKGKDRENSGPSVSITSILSSSFLFHSLGLDMSSFQAVEVIGLG